MTDDRVRRAARNGRQELNCIYRSLRRPAYAAYTNKLALDTPAGRGLYIRYVRGVYINDSGLTNRLV